jgi:hypothetical protein
MKNKTKLHWPGGLVLIGAILLILSLAACSAMTNSAQGKVVAQFMSAMLAKDVAAATGLFPTGSEAEMQPQLEGLLTNQGYLFEGYESISVSSINVSTSGGKTTAAVEGSASYSGGIKGSFTASFIKQGEAWKLTNININVPQEKVQK